MLSQPSRGRPRALAGATILQLVPTLADTPAGHAAVAIARTLSDAGARALVAGDGGALAGELRDCGGEWLPLPNDSVNPLRIRRNAGALRQIIAAERVDIVHAHGAGAAWSALQAVRGQPVFLVTSFPDRMPSTRWPLPMITASLARGDRIIAPSSYVSQAMIDRYRIAPQRITVIPRAVDTASFSPAVGGERIAALRRLWRVPPDRRIVLVVGRIAPRNGQMSMIDAARLVVAQGGRELAFVFAGDDRLHPRYAASLRRRAQAHGIDTLCRFVGHCTDMPTALAAADVVVVPCLQPPLTGRMVAEAQAVGRAVVTTAVGMLPENVLAPPRMRAELRTGWVVRPGQAGELAEALRAALANDALAAEALGARARRFAAFMFSPQSVAEAIREVYTSLLSRDS